MKELEWWYDITTRHFVLYEWEWNGEDEQRLCSVRMVAIFKPKLLVQQKFDILSPFTSTREIRL